MRRDRRHRRGRDPGAGPAGRGRSARRPSASLVPWPWEGAQGRGPLGAGRGARAGAQRRSYPGRGAGPGRPRELSVAPPASKERAIAGRRRPWDGPARECTPEASRPGTGGHHRVQRAAGGQACRRSWRPCSAWRCCPRSPHEVGAREPATFRAFGNFWRHPTRAPRVAGSRRPGEGGGGRPGAEWGPESWTRGERLTLPRVACPMGRNRAARAWNRVWGRV